MKKFIYLLIAGMAFTATSCLNEQRISAEVQLVSAEEMQHILEQEDVQLVDVRTPEEYEEAHIVNSQNIDFRSPTFDEDVKQLDKSKPVILYCRSGKRSAECAKKLKEAGFEKIYDLEGGISKWQHSEDIEIQEKTQP
jgi:rhodanese-related sulfurtransferase